MKVGFSLFPFVSMAHRYHGQIGANLILGGVDCTGNHLYKVGPYGSVDKMPYGAMGTSSLLQQPCSIITLRVRFIGRFLMFSPVYFVSVKDLVTLLLLGF